MKIIIDTNLWISFLLSKKLNFIDSLLSSDKIQLVFSKQLIAEFIDVSNRPKLKRFFTKKDYELVFDIIDRFSILINTTSEVEECRDNKDNFLLALAKDSNADFLITGDNDLLILNPFENTKIVTIKEFENIIIKN